MNSLLIFNNRIWARLLLGVMVIAAAYHAQADQRFGSEGRDGRNGLSGRSGRSGDDVQVKANGQAMHLILNGEDGEDSRSPGERGENAYNCRPSGDPTPAYNLVGAMGGDGGNGGEGGSGGRGGDVTILYKNLEDVRKIVVSSLGGVGGRGARGSVGGYGCDCIRRAWTVEHCYLRGPDNEKVCENRSYFCEPGRNGDQGRDGQSGARARRGALTLVKGDALPTREVLNINLPLQDIVRTTNVLKDNIWVDRSGALTLLAPGSMLDNDYTEFIRQDVVSATVVWSAKRALQDFSNAQAELTLRNGIVNLSLSSNVWTTLEKRESANAVEFNIVNALKQSEVENVSIDISGSAAKTVIRIKNGAALADLVKSTVEVNVWKDKVFGDDISVAEKFDAQSLQKDGLDLLLPIGTMATKEKDTFKPGKKIKWQVVMRRSMGPHSTVINTDKNKYKLPK